METDFRKIIFMSKHIIPYLRTYVQKTTYLLNMTLKTYLHKYLDKLEHNTCGNSNKDTNTSFAIMCNKTEFIRKAIEDNIS